MSALPKICYPLSQDAKKDLSKLSTSEIQSAISRQWGKGLKVKSASFSRFEGSNGETAVYKMTWDDPEHREKNASGTLYVEYSGGSLQTEFGS